MIGESLSESRAEKSIGPRLVVCGLPGVGKNTITEYTVSALNAELLRTYVTRKELFPDLEYTPEEVRTVHDELLGRTADRLMRPTGECGPNRRILVCTHSGQNSSTDTNLLF